MRVVSADNTIIPTCLHTRSSINLHEKTNAAAQRTSTQNVPKGWSLHWEVYKCALVCGVGGDARVNVCQCLQSSLCLLTYSVVRLDRLDQVLHIFANSGNTLEFTCSTSSRKSPGNKRHARVLDSFLYIPPVPFWSLGSRFSARECVLKPRPWPQTLSLLGGQHTRSMKAPKTLAGNLPEDKCSGLARADVRLVVWAACMGKAHRTINNALRYDTLPPQGVRGTTPASLLPRRDSARARFSWDSGSRGASTKRLNWAWLVSQLVSQLLRRREEGGQRLSIVLRALRRGAI